MIPSFRINPPFTTSRARSRLPSKSMYFVFAQEKATCKAAVMLTMLSSLQPQKSSTPSWAPISAIFNAWLTPPHFMSLILKIPDARGGFTSSKALLGVSNDSSAAITFLISSGNFFIASISFAGNGCSINSMSRCFVFW